MDDEVLKVKEKSTEEKEAEIDALLDGVLQRMRAIRFCVECLMQRVGKKDSGGLG